MRVDERGRYRARHIILKRNEIKNLCYLFSNIEQLIIEGALESIEMISLLLDELKHIYFLSVYSTNLKSLNKYTTRQILLNQPGTKLNENNFICKYLDDRLNIWID